MVDINSSFQKGFEQPKADEVKNKSEKTAESPAEQEPQQAEAPSLKTPDNASINNEYKSHGKAVNTVSFDHKKEDMVSFLSQKEDLSPAELNILEFISKTNEDNLQAILDAFDQMLEHSRKMMEQYKQYVKEVVIPKEESVKQELQKEAVRTEILKNK